MREPESGPGRPPPDTMQPEAQDTETQGTETRRQEKHKQVVALVDRDLCSLAAVRGAVPHALRAGTPLVVVYRRPALPTITMMTVPIALLNEDEVEADTFKRVARMLAPHGLPWDFRPLDPGSNLRNCWQLGDRNTSLVVTAGHRGRWLPFVGANKTRRTLSRLRGIAASVVVLGCDHGDVGQGVSATDG